MDWLLHWWGNQIKICQNSKYLSVFLCETDSIEPSTRPWPKLNAAKFYDRRNLGKIFSNNFPLFGDMYCQIPNVIFKNRFPFCLWFFCIKNAIGIFHSPSFPVLGIRNAHWTDSFDIILDSHFLLLTTLDWFVFVFHRHYVGIHGHQLYDTLGWFGLMLHAS